MPLTTRSFPWAPFRQLQNRTLLGKAPPHEWLPRHHPSGGFPASPRNKTLQHPLSYAASSQTSGSQLGVGRPLSWVLYLCSSSGCLFLLFLKSSLQYFLANPFYPNPLIFSCSSYYVTSVSSLNPHWYTRYFNWMFVFLYSTCYFCLYMYIITMF